MFNQDRIRVTERSFKAGRAEVVAAVGKIRSLARKILIIGIYIPPRTRAKQVTAIMDMLNDEISKAKTELNDPIIILGGDFNKKPYGDAVNDFPDIKLLNTGPTRKNETLDLVFTNIHESDASIEPPLETQDGSLKSDHSTVLVLSLIHISEPTRPY